MNDFYLHQKGQFVGFRTTMEGAEVGLAPFVPIPEPSPFLGRVGACMATTGLVFGFLLNRTSLVLLFIIGYLVVIYCDPQRLRRRNLRRQRRAV